MTVGIDESGVVPAKPAHYPNFDYLRLLAASSVIFSHAFLLAEGHERNEPIAVLLGSWNNSGLYGVLVFFVLSGYLITQSAASSGLWAYTVKRIGRIYPAMIVCFALSGFIIGAAYSELGAATYYRWHMPLKYLWDATITLDAWNAPTVNFYDNFPNNTIMNGSIWTIRHELICYVILAILLSLRLLRITSILSILLILIGVYIYGLPYLTGETKKLVGDFVFVAPSFFVGSTIFLATRNLSSWPAWPMAIAAAILVLALHMQKTLELFPLYGAYPLIRLGRSQRFCAPSLKRFGDISYGMYLYGWPVEQVYRAQLGPGKPYLLAAISLITAAVLGYASWHLFEKRVLRWTHYFHGEGWKQMRSRKWLMK